MMIRIMITVVFILQVCSGKFTVPRTCDEISDTTAATLVIDMIRQLKWENLAVIYDNIEPVVVCLRDHILHLFDEGKVRRTVYKVRKSTINATLSNIHVTDFPKIHIVYLTSQSSEIVSAIMKAANDFDFYSNGTTEFRLKSKWILLTYSNVIQDLRMVLRDLFHVSTVTLSGSEAYCVKTLMKRENVSSFIQRQPNHFSENSLFPQARYKYNGRKLIIGILPYQHVQRRMVNGSSVYYGWMIDVLNDIASALNFTYILQEPKDGKWGLKTGNNTWDGLIGELQRHEIDILYAEYIITKQRSEVMDFILPPMFSTSLVIIYRNRNVLEEFSWFSILKPLKVEVYLTVGAVYLLNSFFIISLETINGRRNGSIMEVLFRLFGCLVLEGGSFRLGSRYSRVLYASWWIFCVITTSVYVGQLTSSLLIKEKKTPFTNLRELTQQKTFKYGIEKDSASYLRFQSSSNPEIRNIWKGMVELNKTDPHIISNDSFGLREKVHTSDFALFIPYFKNLSNDCSINVVGDIFEHQFSAISVYHNSPLADNLQRIMRILSQSGLVEYYKYLNEGRRQPLPCRVQENLTDSTATVFSQMKGIFAFAGIGLTLSATSLIIEYIISKTEKCPTYNDFLWLQKWGIEM